MVVSLVANYDPAEYWNERVGTNATLLDVGHYQLGAYNRIAYRFRRRALLGILRLFPPPVPAMTVFEAGFGVGFYLGIWKRLGFDNVTGADLSKAAVDKGRLAFPTFRLLHHDIVNPIPVCGDFDLVTAIDVLYHIVDDAKWEAALANLAALVKPGGHLVLTDKFPAQQPYQTFSHVRRRPLSWYADRLHLHGLLIRHIAPVFVLMDDPLPFGDPRWLASVSYFQWRALTKLIRIFGFEPRIRDAVALAVASLQYPVESLALQALRRSPNLEMVLAVKA